MEYEVTGTDDNHIAKHNHTPQCDVFILMYDSGDNIRSSRASVAIEYDSKACTAHDGTYHTSHEILPRSQYKRWCIVGTQISFDKYFYHYEAPRKPEDIMTEIKVLESEIEDTLKGVFK